MRVGSFSSMVVKVTSSDESRLEEEDIVNGYCDS
jgi:hypothetical protein